ncbi:MAG: TetR/AcrR family transcriptional regulator [FCB group bacterium]|nr:TetR/AcrR family transcriptional regulator [FCB group bacterium]
MITRRMKRADRIEQILDCTLKLIEYKSMVSIRTAEIAKAAGVTEGTLFKYFSSKEDILNRIIKRYLDSQHPLTPAEDIRTKEEFRIFLDKYLTSMITTSRQRRAYLRLLLQISLDQHALSFQKYRQMKNGLWAVMENRIEYGKKHWGFRSDFDTPVQVRLFHLSVLMFFIEQEVFGAKSIEKFDLSKVKKIAIDNLFNLLENKTTND